MQRRRHRRLHRHRRGCAVAAVGLLALLGAVACSAETDPDSDSRSGSGSVPDAGGAGEPDRPLIVLGGDSVMRDVVPAVEAALDDAVEVRFLAQATITRDASARQAWRAEVADRDPDLVVLSVGPWEVANPDFAPSEAAWRRYFASEVLDSYATLLTGGGARMLVIGPPSARGQFQTLGLAVINHFFSDLAERNEVVDFLDASAYVDTPTRTFSETLPGSDGGPERVRRSDASGVHLCPAGVVRLVTPMLDWIGTHSPQPIEPAPGWQDGAWSHPPELRAPSECPASA